MLLVMQGSGWGVTGYIVAAQCQSGVVPNAKELVLGRRCTD